MSEEILAELTATDAEGDGGLPYVPPLAQYGEERETVPGLLAGVQLVGSLKTPYIADGVAYLPLTPGGGGDDDSPTGCNCVPAFYDKEVGSTLGLIRSIGFKEDLQACGIKGGNIEMPLATSHDGCTGVAGGVVAVQYNSKETTPRIDNGVIILPAPTTPAMPIAGLYDAVHAQGLTWEQLKGAGPVQLSYSSKYGYGIKAFMLGEYLSLFIEE